ncbi:MAG TPA: tetraacyldisaccharide 4'-kinase [Ignavibacteriaceae bacterium]|nr:tetraacyldisaccharide 4'-kinase [Ignavibacteriaceae bacterium]
MKLVRFLLLPVLPLYSAIILIRNWFFDRKILKSEKIPVNIISVGNITVGGSGKTPLVIYLLNLLRREGKKPAVLSRGYRRRSKGYLLISDGTEILANVTKSGDEIYHTVSECKVPGAVSESRVKGAKKLIEDADIDVIVLDDAFQHRWIARDIDLVICEQHFLFQKGFMNHSLLPVGILREPFRSLSRASAVIINRKFSPKRDLPEKCLRYFEGKRIFSAFYRATGFVDVRRKTEYSLGEFEGQKSLVVSGIANPYSFINILKQTNVDTENQLVFRDHKDYSFGDIQKIRKTFYSTNSHSVVTTQKDAVKFTKFSKEIDDIDIFYLKIELAMDDMEGFHKFIVNGLQNEKGGQIRYNN